MAVLQNLELRSVNAPQHGSHQDLFLHATTPCGPTAECPIFRGSYDTDSNTLLRWGGARDSGGQIFSGSLEPHYWTVTPTSNNTEKEIGHAQLCASQTSTTITTHHTNTHTTAHTQMLFPTVIMPL